MIEIKEFFSIGLSLITLTSFFVTIKHNGTQNKKIIDDNDKKTKDKFDDVEEKLKKKHDRLKLLEEQKIKFTEALNRTYMTNDHAYITFVQNKDYEKDTKQINKSIEELKKENQESNNKTHNYLIEILKK